MRSYLTALLLLSTPVAALAQDPGLHHARAGAMLSLADEDTKLLYAAVTAKVFDIELTTTILADLKSALGDAKASAFRAAQLVEDEKNSAEMSKLDEALRALEGRLVKLDADVKAETKSMKVDDDNPDLAPAAGAAAKGEDAKAPSWDLLKDGVGGFYVELSAARALHGKLGKIAKPPALKPPPAPKKK